MSTIFHDLQEAIADRLRAQASLSGVSVITQDGGNLEQQAQEAMASLGTAVIVNPLSGQVDNPNAPGPYFDRVAIPITISEDPQHSDQISAVQAAEAVLCALHHWTPSTPGVQTIVATGPNPVQVDSLTLNILDLNFQTRFGLSST